MPGFDDPEWWPIREWAARKLRRWAARIQPRSTGRHFVVASVEPGDVAEIAKAWGDDPGRVQLGIDPADDARGFE